MNADMADNVPLFLQYKDGAWAFVLDGRLESARHDIDRHGRFGADRAFLSDSSHDVRHRWSVRLACRSYRHVAVHRTIMPVLADAPGDR